MNTSKHPDNSRVRKFYVRHLRPHLKSHLSRQRIKLVWFIWGYYPLLLINLPLKQRLQLLFRFLKVDWNVPHAHSPREITAICRELISQGSIGGEMIEAGCWQGGSSCKFSLLCKMLGTRLHIYDSFEGVEPQKFDHSWSKQEQWDNTSYAGQYASGEDVLRSHLEQFGEIEVCQIYKGWFSETIQKGVAFPVKAAYIDCDLIKGTLEVLEGVLPSLVKDGLVFSQDFHIKSINKCLADVKTWDNFGRSPAIKRLSFKLALFMFE